MNPLSPLSRETHERLSASYVGWLRNPQALSHERVQANAEATPEPTEADALPAEGDAGREYKAALAALRAEYAAEPRSLEKLATAWVRFRRAFSGAIRSTTDGEDAIGRYTDKVAASYQDYAANPDAWVAEQVRACQRFFRRREASGADGNWEAYSARDVDHVQASRSTGDVEVVRFCVPLRAG